MLLFPIKHKILFLSLLYIEGLEILFTIRQNFHLVCVVVLFKNPFCISLTKVSLHHPVQYSYLLNLPSWLFPYCIYSTPISCVAFSCYFLNPELYFIFSWSLLLLRKASSELCLKSPEKFCMASSVFSFSCSSPFKANTSSCLPVTIQKL